MQQRRPLGRWKRIVFSCVLFLVPLTLIELAVRVYFSTVVGPSVLLYGTGFARQSVDPTERRAPAAESTSHPKEAKDYLTASRRAQWTTRSVEQHQNAAAGGYAKYYPNQSRFDFDVETGERFPVTINSKGFRGRDFSEQKAPHTIRVVTLGASSTLGYFARDDETYPVYLEKLLNESLPGDSIEVINLGIPHLTVANIHALLMNEALPLDPDVITFYEGNNDAMHLEDALTQQSSLRKIAGMVGGRVLTVAFIANFLDNPWHRAHSPEVVATHSEAIADDFLRHLSGINEECQKRGILFVVASQQRNSQSVGRQALKGMTYQQERAHIEGRLRANQKMTPQELTFLAHAILMDRLHEWARTNHVPYADVIARLDQDRDVLVSWVHLSARGNQLVAAAFADEIRRHWPPARAATQATAARTTRRRPRREESKS
jgi:lysophospholipase L1-like esterase